MRNVNIPVIPKEVAEAIEEVKADPKNTTMYSQLGAFEARHWGKFAHFLYLDVVMAALVNGYTVEKTKRELVDGVIRRYYGSSTASIVLDEIERIYEGGCG